MVTATRRETVFIDTGWFVASVDPNDQFHRAALATVAELRQRGVRYVTTDYVLEETATLLRARRRTHVVARLFAKVFASEDIAVVWMTPERFSEVAGFFHRHGDKAWSFTDCFSFVVMRERGMASALAADAHFRQAGFETLLLD
ncbi:MAG: type II toxin-antitoxin system VapC family toxin [Lacipirellulaceae bacterium]